MKVHLAPASGSEKNLLRFGEMQAMHERSSGKHSLVADPALAEMILLVGDLTSLKEAKRNVFLRDYREKTMVYSEIDAVVPYGPGVYCSGAKANLLNLRRTRSDVYVSRYVSSENSYIRHRHGEPKNLLFSFMGRRGCRVRARLIDEPYNRSDVFVRDTTAYRHWGDSEVDREQAQRDYADILARSHFALCPRGAGFGSIRLFEVMEMGVAPVLLADRYALPVGPDWDSFLLRIAEKDYARLPEVLERHVAESAERGQRARSAWEEFFAPEKVFDRLIEQLTEIRREMWLPETVYQRFWPWLQIRAELRPWVSSQARRGQLQLRRMLGYKTPPSGWVNSDPR
jgi:Exostosin family